MSNSSIGLKIQDWIATNSTFNLPSLEYSKLKDLIKSGQNQVFLVELDKYLDLLSSSYSSLPKFTQSEYQKLFRVLALITFSISKLIQRYDLKFELKIRNQYHQNLWESSWYQDLRNSDHYYQLEKSDLDDFSCVNCRKKVPTLALKCGDHYCSFCLKNLRLHLSTRCLICHQKFNPDPVLVAVEELMKKRLPFKNFMMTPFNHPHRRKVLILALDGLRPDAFLFNLTPAFRNFIKEPRTIYSFYNQTITNTFSGPCWTSILTGQLENKHKIHNNGQLESDTKLKSLQSDLLGQILKKEKPEKTILGICSTWTGMANLMKNSFDRVYHIRNDPEHNRHNDEYVYDKLKEKLSRTDPYDYDLIMAYVTDIDDVGHKKGFSLDNPDYCQSIKNVFGKLKTTLDQIKTREKEFNEEWMVVVTTDHGGTEKKSMTSEMIQEMIKNGDGTQFAGLHGLNIPSHKNTFVLFNSSDFEHHEIVDHPTSLDLVPTILYHFGLSQKDIKEKYKLPGQILQIQLAQL